MESGTGEEVGLKFRGVIGCRCDEGYFFFVIGGREGDGWRIGL